MVKPKVLALGYPAFAGEEYVKQFQEEYEIDIDLHQVLVPTDRKQTVADLAAKVQSSGPYQALLVRMGIGPYEPFDEELLRPLVPDCKILVSCSAGYNEFDVSWMTQQGMWFCNTRNAVSEATADMAMFLILAVLRDTTRGEKQTREGKWRGTLAPTRDPTGLKLGILGMGGIGKHLARKAAAFNMKIIYYNRQRLPVEDEERLGATYCPTMEELLAQSDVFSVNCPLNDQTVGLIGEKEFAQMKDGVFFINTARGAIVNESALIAALQSGKIERAGLDVFDGEPSVNPFFLECDRCTIQPHLGGLTDGAFQKAEIECLENIKTLFTTGVPVAPINNIST
ncbi:hypothetical protein ASPZODRAFT_139651 [Penicilliopsis zonata CBS 506.65]|uniref:D-isomer specific 2-hydroxyacid dehydrogenase NAD-binding domain-containing protein n=1 Tax=Penicilliopsis zonata CBS 506.65 TaxID=1073090 RepID=A0A1L9ST13_9EURO|nr:hypothetical protein ASPZODRAFT_139651 [Penicilliopsis zonata CBS 506.65]OJJ50348.1 hypothetical protein ASPZODRAFT_139651 [Penicilliopsis zonata CBS 506.65]